MTSNTAGDESLDLSSFPMKNPTDHVTSNTAGDESLDLSSFPMKNPIL